MSPRASVLVLLAWLAACGDPPHSLQEPADSAPPPLPSGPNLTIDSARLAMDLAIEERFFDSAACELDPDEACIDTPGLRRLLRFSVETPNLGDQDLIIGAPEPPLFEYSPCHGHHHFTGFAAYELIDAAGGQLAAGHKQAFCLVDTHRYVDAPESPSMSAYNCNYQGVQRGWSDVYDSSLGCQFIDITDIPDGTYHLRVHINQEQRLPESRYDDNLLVLPITLGESWLETPTEPCPEGGGRALENITRECGWQLMGRFSCTPGERLRVGCAQECALGSCTGDPMLRVCDGQRTDGNCSHPASIGRGGDACGTTCPQASGVICPLSAWIDVYATSRDPSQPFTCQVAIRAF